MVQLLDIKEFKKKAKTRFILNIIFVVLFLLIAIAGIVLLLLLSNIDYIINLISSITIGILAFVATIFYFLNIFPLVSHYYLFYKNMGELALERRLLLEFDSEAEMKTIGKVRYRNLLFIHKEGQKTYLENLYILDNQDVSFNKGTKIKALTYHNVIVRYEVLNDANV